jgi:predicted dehydrogenase
MAQKHPLSRRGFLKGTAIAAGAAIAAPTFVPSISLGKDGATAPSDRILMGIIGCGGMGNGDMGGLMGCKGVQFLAACDVHDRQRDRSLNSINKRNKTKDAKGYLDFRELIGRGDLDAVIMALPDQWHAIPAIAAAKAGLDIYGEKPLARSIREARAMANAVHKYERVWQTGSQQRSESKFRFACELVRNGRIGKVHRVEVGLPTGRPGGDPKEVPVPEGLDWDRWLGPAPYKPFTNGICHFSWRWFMDYSGGQLTDWAGHHIDIAHWGVGMERSGPIEIRPDQVTYPTTGLYNVPTHYQFTCQYDTDTWKGELSVANNQVYKQGAKWYGENGQWIHVSRRGMTVSDDKIKEPIGPGEIHLHPSGNHRANFIDCVRSRKETIAPIEIGLRSISVALLGEIAMLLGRTIKWNPDTEEIIGDPQASAMLGKPYRAPWTLE